LAITGGLAAAMLLAGMAAIHPQQAKAHGNCWLVADWPVWVGSDGYVKGKGQYKCQYNHFYTQVCVRVQESANGGATWYDDSYGFWCNHTNNTYQATYTTSGGRCDRGAKYRAQVKGTVMNSSGEIVHADSYAYSTPVKPCP
jgi:hypothetical protein